MRATVVPATGRYSAIRGSDLDGGVLSVLLGQEAPRGHRAQPPSCAPMRAGPSTQRTVPASNKAHVPASNKPKLKFVFSELVSDRAPSRYLWYVASVTASELQVGLCKDHETAGLRRRLLAELHPKAASRTIGERPFALSIVCTGSQNSTPAYHPHQDMHETSIRVRDPPSRDARTWRGREGPAL